jgi:hypothetical protein
LTLILSGVVLRMPAIMLAASAPNCVPVQISARLPVLRDLSDAIHRLHLRVIAVFRPIRRFQELRGAAQRFGGIISHGRAKNSAGLEDKASRSITLSQSLQPIWKQLIFCSHLRLLIGSAAALENEASCRSRDPWLCARQHRCISAIGRKTP